MSHAAEFELEQYEEAAAKFDKLALVKGWVCKVCSDTPSREELDQFLENDHVCPHCMAAYERHMRD